MIHSFRLRFFLLATAIVATVLAAVMASGWQRALDFETRRLDARLCSEAQRLAREAYAADDLARLEVDILGKLRLATPDQLLLRLKAVSGNGSFQSTHWDAALTPQTLPWQAADSAAQPPQPQPPRPDRPPREETPTPDAGSAPATYAGVPLPDNPPAATDAAPPAPATVAQDGSAPVAVGPVCELAAFDWHDRPWRGARAVMPQASGIVAADLSASRGEIRSALLDALLLEVPLALLLTALGAWLLTSLVMRPVNRLRDAMKNVSPQALDTRLPDAGEDREFKDLISAYNTMLAQLERSFQQASRFSADAAHELKTPLTILRGRLEQARRKAGSDALQADLAELQDETARLAAITRKLLLLSQADAGRLALNLALVDLTGMLDLLMADAQMVAEDKSLRFAIARGLHLQGDALLLRQLLNNLLGNALRYTSAGGRIEVDALRSAAGIAVRFSNTCQSLSPAERAQFFERFYRADAARSRQRDGSGLGLSLALEIAKAHGGELRLLPGLATEVNLLLTLPPEASV